MERKVYLILTDTGTLFTRMIKLYTKKPYNHASLSFDPHFSEIYSFGRKKPRNPFIGGFVKECIYTGLLKQADCAIYSCCISEEQYQEMLRFIKQIEERKEQYRYNFLGLLAIPFQKTLHREHAYFCSQFVAAALTEGKVIQCPKQLSHMTPHDLPQAASFELIYQGTVEGLIHRDSLMRKSRSELKEHAALGKLRKKIASACVFFFWY
jgi:hypothetical protein